MFGNIEMIKTLINHREQILTLAQSNMTTKNIIEGLTILQKYRKNQDGYSVSTGHAQINADSTDEPLSSEDLARLVAMGWIQEEAFLGDEDGFEAKHYSPKEGWTCYV